MGGNKKCGGRNMEAKKDKECGVTNTELPMANLIRLMKKVLPGKAKIGGTAKGLTHDCAVEFVGFIGDEASEKARAEHRRTIAPEDYLDSFGNLGFNRYIEPMQTYISGYREFERVGGNRRVTPPMTTMSLTPDRPTFTDAELQFLRSVIPSLSDNESNSSLPTNDCYDYGYGYGYSEKM